MDTLKSRRVTQFSRIHSVVSFAITCFNLQVTPALEALCPLFEAVLWAEFLCFSGDGSAVYHCWPILFL